MFKAIDAFCGAGGLSLGLSNAGFEILYGFDLDNVCIKTLETNTKYIKHVVEAINIKDILKVGVLSILKIKQGDIHLVAGGPPCQGFSVQRTVGKDDDDRNLLVDDYGDFILEIMPKFFLFENVPGIGGKRGIEIVKAFKQRMIKKGYHCHESVLDAQNYGVPQRRKRFFIVGELVNGNLPIFEWPKITIFKRNTIRDVIGHLPEPSTNKDSSDSLRKLHRADKLSEMNLKRIRHLKQGESRVHLPKELLADCHLLSADVIGHRNVYGRMEWNEVAPTITARFDSFTRGMFGHPEQDRSISLLEGSLLQTFPSDYDFVGNKVEIARQIGNAIPPKLANELGKSILKALIIYEGKNEL